MTRDIITDMIEDRDSKYKTYLLMVNELNRKTIDTELIGSISALGDEIVALQTLIEDAMRRRMEKDDEE